jgi:hypothetical protein
MTRISKQFESWPKIVSQPQGFVCLRLLHFLGLGKEWELRSIFVRILIVTQIELGNLHEGILLFILLQNFV